VSAILVTGFESAVKAVIADAITVYDQASTSSAIFGLPIVLATDRVEFYPTAGRVFLFSWQET
jgi:hypothetical protein